MSSQRGFQRRAFKAFGEFLLIVVGVLVALTADSWWQSRGDRDLEQAYLQQLRIDVQGNVERLTAAIEQEEGYGEKLRSVVEALWGTAAVPRDSALAWMDFSTGGLNYSDPRLLDGTLTALIETGDINLIRDHATRSGAIAYLTLIQRDIAEFNRFSELGLRQSDVFIERSELAAPTAGTSFQDYDEATRLLAIQDDPVARVAFVKALSANGTRRIYLRRMLDATENFEAVLLSESR